MTRVPSVPPVTPATVKRRAGPAGSGYRVLTRMGVPGERRVFSPFARWLLPWGFPFQGSVASALVRISPNLLSRASRDPDSEEFGTAHASESRSANAMSHRPWRRAARPCGTTLVGFSHLASPQRSCWQPFGLFCSPRAASSVSADRRRFFERSAALPEPCGST